MYTLNTFFQNLKNRSFKTPLPTGTWLPLISSSQKVITFHTDERTNIPVLTVRTDVKSASRNNLMRDFFAFSLTSEIVQRALKDGSKYQFSQLDFVLTPTRRVRQSRDWQILRRLTALLGITGVRQLLATQPKGPFSLARGKVRMGVLPSSLGE